MSSRMSTFKIWIIILSIIFASLGWLSLLAFAAYETWNGSFHWSVAFMTMLFILVTGVRGEVFKNKWKLK